MSHDQKFEQFSQNRWVQFTPPEGRRCGPMAPSEETIPAIWVAPLEGGHGVTFEEAYREIGQPRRFDAVGGNGCVKCRRVEDK